MDEALAANAHTAVIAFQYRRLQDEQSASKLAFSRPNMSVYGQDQAIINGVPGRWQPGELQNEDWQDIRGTFWRDAQQNEPARFLLGDFARLARFLALTQAQKMLSATPDQDQHGKNSNENPDPKGHADA